MKFWDSSAVVALLVQDVFSSDVQRILKNDKEIIVWWATEVECVSAIARLEREGNLQRKDVTLALGRLDSLLLSWHEVQPLKSVRTTARRLLRAHNLRAADALQLAAAGAASEGDPPSLDFFSLDERLLAAAEKEGFPIVTT